MTVIGDGAAEAVFLFSQNDDYTIEFTLTAGDIPVNITGREFRLYITDIDKTSYIDADITNGPGGRFIITLPREITGDFEKANNCTTSKDGKFKFGTAMLLQHDGNDKVITMCRGPVYVIISAGIW